jgi:hypothetical protein
MTEFGGFSTNSLSIDLHLRKFVHWQHFHNLWDHHAGANQVTETDSEKRFELFCVGTLLEHELRHFHDFLLSPTAASTFRARLVLLMNSVHLLRDFKNNDDTQVIPVPLDQWLTLPLAARNQIIAVSNRWPEYRGKKFWSPSVFTQESITETVLPRGGQLLNSTKAEDVQRILGVMTKSALNIRTYKKGFWPPGNTIHLTPRFAYECSALLMQLVAVRKTYGDKECAEFLVNIAQRQTMFVSLFIKWLILAAGGDLNDINRGIMYIQDFTDIDVGFLTAVFTWCLIGHPLQEKSPRLGCPAVRMGLLFNTLVEDRQSVYPAEALEPDKYFALWESRFGVKAWRTSLEQHAETFRKACEDITQVADSHIRNAVNDPEAQEAFFDVPRVLNSYGLQREELLQKFLSAPTAYMYPGVYLDYPSRWGTCPLIFDLSNADFSLDISDINSLKGVRMTPPRRQDGKFASGFQLTQESIFGVKNHFNIKSLETVKSLLSTTDVLFFPENFRAWEGLGLSEVEDILGFAIYHL